MCLYFAISTLLSLPTNTLLLFFILDEYFTLILSDANIEQYNIKPSDIARALKSDARVNAYIIFIGTIRDQAERYGHVDGLVNADTSLG